MWRWKSTVLVLIQRYIFYSQKNPLHNPYYKSNSSFDFTNRHVTKKKFLDESEDDFNLLLSRLYYACILRLCRRFDSPPLNSPATSNISYTPSLLKRICRLDAVRPLRIFRALLGDELTVEKHIQTSEFTLKEANHKTTYNFWLSIIPTWFQVSVYFSSFFAIFYRKFLKPVWVAWLYLLLCLLYAEPTLVDSEVF